jgi:hypothetical protein
MHRSFLSAPRRQAWLAGVALTVLFGASATAETSSDSTQGYNGSGVRGYNGSGVRGYNGSGVRGYNGSGVRGYNGSGVRADTGDGCSTGFGDGFTVAAMGPVDSISVAGRTLTVSVLGQAFVVAADESSFAVGDYVVAAQHPSLGTTIYDVGTAYIAGVSLVSVKGLVTHVDHRVGTTAIGAATIDYTALLSGTPEVAPQIDETFEAVGIQPVAGGLIIAGPAEGDTVGCSALDGRM